MLIRRLQAGDEPAIQAFFEQIPEGDQRFFKEDPRDPETPRRWIADRRAPRFVAIDDDDRVVGSSALVPGVGWSAHVAELRVIVDAEHRREGLGSRLVWAALEATREMDLKKLVVEVVADQRDAVALFERLGFQREAVLPGHVRDRAGAEHDLVLLANTGLLAAELEGAGTRS